MNLFGWTRSAKGWCLPVIGTAGLLAVAVVAVRPWSWGAPGRPPAAARAEGPAASRPPRDSPVSLRPTLTFADELDARAVDPLVERLRQDRPVSVSDALHVLRLFGPDAVCKPANGEGAPLPVLDTILDYETGSAYFGGSGPPLIDTREGVRSRVVFRRDARWQPERQAHDDQLLAILAEVGVPLSRRVRTPGGEHTVRNILDDTLANFDLKKQEIEWSALSVALYLPPRNSWFDKYGQRFTLDDVATELMARLYRPRLSCAGTHLLYSMTALMRADEQYAVLTPGVREELREKLREAACALPRSQSPDGMWGADWASPLRETAGAGSPGAAPRGDQILATGHHVEWLMLLPPDMAPPRECLLAALRGLQVRLQADDPQLMRQNYCPYSHAARVLRVLSRREAP